MAFRYDLEYKMLSPQIVDKEGRFIILHIEIQGIPYIILNYYGPNLIFNKSLDPMGGSPSLKFKSLQKLQSIIIDHNLVDIWRTRNPNLRQFTWRRTNPFIKGRLDFF